jgi:hypothetical protein
MINILRNVVTRFAIAEGSSLSTRAHFSGRNLETQAAWWLEEIKAGRIVNSKTRKPIRANTFDAYSTAISYLNGVLGNKSLASLDNPEARGTGCRDKSKGNQRRVVCGLAS